MNNVRHSDQDVDKDPKITADSPQSQAVIEDLPKQEPNLLLNPLINQCDVFFVCISFSYNTHLRL